MIIYSAILKKQTATQIVLKICEQSTILKAVLKVGMTTRYTDKQRITLN